MQSLRYCLMSAALLLACSEQRSPPHGEVPGPSPSASTRALDAGAALLQDRPPIEALNAYLDGFHFRNGSPAEQVEAHHFCSVMSEALIQCVIYDGNTREARLMGVEYIVSAEVFSQLPPQEKALWHSHVHEVKSGQLVGPGLPAAAEKALMKKLVGTYGKTWHTWQSHREPLPLGGPQLMMGFTADSQADAAMVAERDKRIGIDSAERRRQRDDIAAPPIDAGADAWQRGHVVQLPQLP